MTRWRKESDDEKTSITSRNVTVYLASKKPDFPSQNYQLPETVPYILWKADSISQMTYLYSSKKTRLQQYAIRSSKSSLLGAVSFWHFYGKIVKKYATNLSPPLTNMPESLGRTAPQKSSDLIAGAESRAQTLQGVYQHEIARDRRISEKATQGITSSIPRQHPPSPSLIMCRNCTQSPEKACVSRGTPANSTSHLYCGTTAHPSSETHLFFLFFFFSASSASAFAPSAVSVAAVSLPMEAAFSASATAESCEVHAASSACRSKNTG